MWGTHGNIISGMIVQCEEARSTSTVKRFASLTQIHVAIPETFFSRTTFSVNIALLIPWRDGLPVDTRYNVPLTRALASINPSFARFRHWYSLCAWRLFDFVRSRSKRTSFAIAFFHTFFNSSPRILTQSTYLFGCLRSSGGLFSSTTNCMRSFLNFRTCIHRNN